MATAEAQVSAAEAALQRAKLNLKRTSVSVPFNALVESRDVEVGAEVTPNSVLGRLVGTDAYWIEVSVPVNQLHWIRIPVRAGEPGSPVRVCTEVADGPSACRSGEVLRKASALEEQGRMARLLVSVPDPLRIEEAQADMPELILGSYVRVEIEGAQEMRVAVLDRALLQDGNRVWIAGEGDKLESRQVEIAFRTPQSVYVVGGLREGERLITTSLTGAVEGMPLRFNDDGPPQPKRSQRENSSDDAG